MEEEDFYAIMQSANLRVNSGHLLQLEYKAKALSAKVQAGMLGSKTHRVTVCVPQHQSTPADLQAACNCVGSGTALCLLWQITLSQCRLARSTRQTGSVHVLVSS